MTGVTEDRGARARPLILVAEDYTDARELFQEYLELEGFDVVVAKNGEQAVELARELLPDLILMDLSMPVLDGFDATRALKQDESTSHIPVVAHSGHAMAIHRLRAREAGCDSVMPKPTVPNAIAAKIRALLPISKPRD